MPPTFDNNIDDLILAGSTTGAPDTNVVVITRARLRKRTLEDSIIT